ncbi:MAG: hypothetical protein GF334_07690 [Candidatus Altiarchaeales archaeon]|nr:hypothetical protein [Candidatus Altiarchaeales archaeon]
MGNVIVVYAIDALEHILVEKFQNKNLMQTTYGKTDITQFSQPRTMVLWSSFMTCEDKEQAVLSLGDEKMWGVRWPLEETFFKEFKNPKIIDLPGFNYDMDVHDKSRALLKEYFESEDRQTKAEVKKQYNQDAYQHHRSVKKEFLESLEDGHDFVLGYFSAADVLGHLNFGNKTMMRMIYKDLDEIAAEVQKKTDKILVLSDHGMKAIGEFGDHSEYGFYSTSWESNLEHPRITDFGDILTRL